MLAHSIEEYDQVKLLSELGYDVFSLGGYINPHMPHDPKRPAIPDAPYHPDLKEVVDTLRTPDNLEAAKQHVPDAVLDWCETIIIHHREHTWLVPQWDRIKHKRVIWRTVGQSVENNEKMMKPFREQGLQIVRYSPKEENIPSYAGRDALIRFYKDPDEWTGWGGGEYECVINITQQLRQREPFTNWSFWDEATRGLPHKAIGPGSEFIEGPGEISLQEMKAALRLYRAYLYTGTQPAAYTLGLVEAMMTGIPVVSIGPLRMQVFPYSPQLFEGHEIARHWANSPTNAHDMLVELLSSSEYSAKVSAAQRARAIELFGKETIAKQWKEFLG